MKKGFVAFAAGYMLASAIDCGVVVCAGVLGAGLGILIEHLIH